MEMVQVEESICFHFVDDSEVLLDDLGQYAV